MQTITRNETRAVTDIRENYGKFFAVTVRKPKNTLRYMHIAWLGAYILIAEHWLEKEEIVFTNGDYDCKP